MLVRKFRTLGTDILLENIYGPTEGTVYSCNYSLSHWQGKGSIPIGKPMQNVNLYILDKHNIIQPVGIAGELCIGGVGVARGYLNNPQLTAERFLYRSYRYYRSYGSYKSYILYFTGDLARWYPDGNIQFLGRKDHQVKIRGFRIEPGEVENQLLKHPDINETVVIARQNENGDSYLYAYIVSPASARSDALSVPRLREYLAGTLPDYMVPSHFMQLDKIPLTTNGKVDKKALDVLGKRLQAGADHIPPTTKIEKIIAGIWQEVLQSDKVGIHDRFFDQGGTSLDVIKVTARLKEILKTDIPVVKMFLYPTVGSMAKYLEQAHYNVTPGDLDSLDAAAVNIRSDKQIDASADVMEDALQLLVEDDNE
jgi:acyl carrier protein